MEDGSREMSHEGVRAVKKHTNKTAAKESRGAGEIAWQSQAHQFAGGHGISGKSTFRVLVTSETTYHLGRRRPELRDHLSMKANLGVWEN